MSCSPSASPAARSVNLSAGGTDAALVFHGIACGNCFRMPVANESICGRRLQHNPLQPCGACRQIRFCNKACHDQACAIGDHGVFCRVLARIPSRWRKRNISAQGPRGWAEMIKGDGLAALRRFRGMCDIPIASDALKLSRHCAVCNRTPAEADLRPCRVCFWDWSCDAHSDNRCRPPELQHTAEACLRYRDANALALARLTWKTAYSGSDDDDASDLNRASDASFPPSSGLEALHNLETYSMQGWDDFFQWRFRFALADAAGRRSECIDATFDASRPLTLLRALQNYEMSKKDVLVHVIGAGTFDMRSGGAMWRLVLHHLRPSIRLRVVFIGPELHNSCLRQWPDTDLCLASFVHATYQVFRTQTTFEKPDVAIAFNAGLHHYDDWGPALLVLMDLNIPVVITCRTSEETLEYDKLKSVGAKLSQFPIKNPFSSLVPTLRFGRDSLFEFDNEFYICFKGRAIPLPRPMPSQTPVSKPPTCARQAVPARRDGGDTKSEVLPLAHQKHRHSLRTLGAKPKAAGRTGALKSTNRNEGSRRVRAAFTEEDDRAMRQWVAERPTWPDQGKKIWEEAEKAKVTTHSWQSMQNHWRRCLRTLDSGVAQRHRALPLGDAAKSDVVLQASCKRPKTDCQTQSCT